jgi:hypothetical protein
MLIVTRGYAMPFLFHLYGVGVGRSGGSVGRGGGLVGGGLVGGGLVGGGGGGLVGGGSVCRGRLVGGGAGGSVGGAGGLVGVGGACVTGGGVAVGVGVGVLVGVGVGGVVVVDFEDGVRAKTVAVGSVSVYSVISGSASGDAMCISWPDGSVMIPASVSQAMAPSWTTRCVPPSLTLMSRCAGALKIVTRQAGTTNSYVVPCATNSSAPS